MGTSPTTSPLPLEEAKHLVYVFCDGVDSTRFNHRHKESSSRSYCARCRHVHKGSLYSEGFEKYFTMKLRFQDRSSERSPGSNLTCAKGKRKDYRWRTDGNDWKSLTVEGFKMYGVNDTKDRGLREKREVLHNSSYQKREKPNTKLTSARSGCTVCDKPRKSSRQSQTISFGNKMIKIVLPSIDSKSPSSV